jgi:2',3'-cyclic-nucleotide 2'-phosphodiesterase
MNILLIGDIVGKPGRRAVAGLLPDLVNEKEIDFVIANGENAAGGMGITAEIVEDLFSLGINVLTTGNHVWKNRQAYDIIQTEERLLRPANYPDIAPGRGSGIYHSPSAGSIGVLNLIGRVFMDAVDDPFRVGLAEVERLLQETPVILVDMHAEATSEKVAMGWYLDGKVSAVLGTHTHVQTADERILPHGTAYISDVGMSGPRDSVIGIKPELILERFISKLPNRFELAGGTAQLNAVVVHIESTTGKAEGIERIFRLLPPA